MKPTNKKGQAALEFLSTYGFAFLIILVMIGALAYFGVLNPSNFLPDRCTSSPNMGCEEAAIVTDGTTLDATVILVNRAGSPIQATGANAITFSSTINGEDQGACTVTDLAGAALTSAISTGQRFQVECPLDPQYIAEGARVAVDIASTYYTVGGSLPQTAEVNVNYRIQG